MSYPSVDKLQNILSKTIFHYAKDAKKASGRALGTMVEIITYYLLKSWELNDNIAIERGLEEYGNPDITHNVEYSLHPIIAQFEAQIQKGTGTAISSAKILRILKQDGINLANFRPKGNNLLSRDLVLRNACTIAFDSKSNLLTSIEKEDKDIYYLRIFEQHNKAFAIFECKRVGIEEGMNKGPQTIEKAKQGAYVARVVSSLHKIRNEKGEMIGAIHMNDGTLVSKPFVQLLDEIIYSKNNDLLRKFILTVGVVSNHGNWFTSDNQNKEMKVLSQSYDWLLFLTDKGLSDFIDRLLLNPKPQYKMVKDAFTSSYGTNKKKNQFTKVQMNLKADGVLLNFFREKQEEIESWFNVISPREKKIKELKKELRELKNKNWAKILA